jgi:hypothetical protein
LTATRRLGIAAALLTLACGDAATGPAPRDSEDQDLILESGAVRLRLDNRGVIAYGSDQRGIGAFPRGSSNNYLFFAALWVGGLRRGVPVVSTTFDFGANEEFAPGQVEAAGEGGRLLCWSRAEDRRRWYPEFSSPTGEALRVGDEDCVVIFNDANPAFGGSPLGIEVHQRASVFATGLQSQAVLFTWAILNTSQEALDQAFVGVLVDADVGPDFMDDLCSAILAVPAGRNNSTGLAQPANLGFCWDHDFHEPTFAPAPPGFVGVTLLRAPAGVARPLTRFTSGTNPLWANPPNLFMADDAQYDILTGSGIWEPFVLDVLADQRFFVVTGPFRLEPGEREQVTAAFVWADAAAPVDSLALDSARCFPERRPCLLPDPNDPVLAELVAVQQAIQQVADQRLP